MTPLFSIITPSYNKAQYISSMIESVLDQTETNWELIVIDDGSTDGTKEILKQFEHTDKRFNFKYHSENKGANYCRNLGVALASGTYTIFVDADDLIASFCLNQRKQAIKTKTEADIWIFNMAVFNYKIGDLPSSKNWIVSDRTEKFLELFLNHSIPWQTMQSTWRTSYLIEFGGFDPEFREFDDVEVHTSAILHGARIMPFKHLPVDVFYRIDENRKERSVFDHQTLIVSTAIKYYSKFFPKVKSEKNRKLLSGSLFQPLTSLCWQHRKNKITTAEFTRLKNKLIEACQYEQHQKKMNLYQKISKALPFHLPGLKK
ncbi:MAG: glycosyltransferase family 2 protein, partial [Crocinitomicaceae bacterium]